MLTLELQIHFVHDSLLNRHLVQKCAFCLKPRDTQVVEKAKGHKANESSVPTMTDLMISGK